MTVWCYLLGLHRPENNNASQKKDYQSPVLLRQLGIIFQLYSLESPAIKPPYVKYKIRCIISSNIHKLEFSWSSDTTFGTVGVQLTF